MSDLELLAKIRRVAGEVELAVPRTRSVRDVRTGRYPLPPATGTTIVGRRHVVVRALASAARLFGLREDT